MTSRPPDDDDVLDRLAAALRDTSALGAGVAAAGRAAFPWRTVDAELAELSFDSTLQPATAIRAGDDDTRRVVFTGRVQSVELEVLDDRLLGQLLPSAAGAVVVETQDGGAAPDVVVDEDGFFTIAPVPRAVIRLRCETAAGRIVSPWLRL